MQKVTIADLKDPQKKISVAPLTKEQHEKLVLHYLAPIDMPEYCTNKGEPFYPILVETYRSNSGICFPASLVEAYFTPVYEKTVHLSEGDYTEEELQEYLKQVKP